MKRLITIFILVTIFVPSASHGAFWGLYKTPQERKVEQLEREVSELKKQVQEIKLMMEV